MSSSIQISISIAIKTLFRYLYPKIDVELYYKIYEQQIQKLFHLPVHWFWRWLFKERDVKIFRTTYKNAVPRYRVFHAAVGILYWAAAWIIFYSSLPWYVFLIDAIAGILWAYYWMTFEYLYYVISKTIFDVLEYERNHTEVYWLKRLWFAGKWLFDPEFKPGYPPPPCGPVGSDSDSGFKLWKFQLAVLIGIIGMYLTSIIYLII